MIGVSCITVKGVTMEGLITLVFLLAIYYLPSIIAFQRNHPSSMAIDGNIKVSGKLPVTFATNVATFVLSICICNVVIASDRGRFRPDLTSEFNQSLPVMIDKGTRLDSVIVYDYEMTYTNTMINRSSQELKGTAFIKIMKSHIKNGACSNPKVIPMLRNGVSLIYSYKGSDNIYIGQFTIKPSDCGY